MDYGNQNEFEYYHSRLIKDIQVTNAEIAVLKREEAYLSGLFGKKIFSQKLLRQPLDKKLIHLLAEFIRTFYYARKILNEVLVKLEAKQEETKNLTDLRMILRRLTEDIKNVENIAKILRSSYKRDAAASNSLSVFIQEVLPRAKALLNELTIMVESLEKLSAERMKARKGILTEEAISEASERINNDVMFIDEEVNACKKEEAELNEIFSKMGLHSNSLTDQIREYIFLTASMLGFIRTAIDYAKNDIRINRKAEDHLELLKFDLSKLEEDINILERLIRTFGSKYRAYSKISGSVSQFISHFLPGLRALDAELRATIQFIEKKQISRRR